MRRWLVYAALALMALVGVVVVVGYALPVAHSVQGQVTLAAPPAEVFAVISDFERYPEWRSAVTRVEIDGDGGVGRRVVETGRDGTIPYRIEVLAPPERLVLRIDDPDLPFGGTWTYALEPSPAGTLLTITEDGEVYNPIFRLLSRFVFGHRATIDGYLRDLEARMQRERAGGPAPSGPGTLAQRPSIFQNAMPPACLPMSTAAARVRVARS